MSDQLALFVEPAARRTDPATSRAAAESVARSHSGRLLRIQRIVAESDFWGCTADEVWHQVCVEDQGPKRPTRSTWHSAVSAAAKAGLIVPNGARRLSDNGVVMAVYTTERHQ